MLIHISFNNCKPCPAKNSLLIPILIPLVFELRQGPLLVLFINPLTQEIGSFSYSKESKALQGWNAKAYNYDLNPKIKMSKRVKLIINLHYVPTEEDMAFTPLEKEEIEHLLSECLADRKQHAAKKGFDIGYKFNNQSIEFFETLPSSDNEQGFFNLPVAKISYVRTQDVWKIYWVRGSLKWQGYLRCSETKKFNEALFFVNEDIDQIFWGVSSIK